MGYRSEVAFIIEPTHVTGTEFLKEFGTAMPVEHLLIREGWLKDSLKVTATQVRFHTGDVKWYSKRLAGGMASEGYEEIDAYETLFAWAQEQEFDAYRANRGAFARVGEETGDIDTIYWGDDAYDLVNVQTIIDMSVTG